MCLAFVFFCCCFLLSQTVLFFYCCVANLPQTSRLIKIAQICYFIVGGSGVRAQHGSPGFLCLRSHKARIKMLVRTAVSSEVQDHLPSSFKWLLGFSSLRLLD